MHMAHPALLRLVVTGGYGFMGTNLILAAVGRGHDFVVLDDLSIGNGRYLREVPHSVVTSMSQDEVRSYMRREGAA